MAGFTIPNEADAGATTQAELDKVDFDILTAGFAGSGVLRGCAVTAQGSPDMTVAVADGVVSIGNVFADVDADNVTVGAAHASNPRFDLITVDNTGALACTAGTAAASPVFPAIPANSIVIAAVYIPGADTDIDANQIIDKRVILPQRLAFMRNGDAPTLGNNVGRSIQVGVGRGSTVANETFVAGEDITEIDVGPVYKFETTAAGNLIGIDSSPSVLLTNDSANMGEVVGVMGQPTVAGTTDAWTVDQMHGVEALPTMGAVNATATLMRGLWAQVNATFGTVTLAVGVDIHSTASFGTMTECIGLRIKDLAGGTTKWGFQVGNYQSYHEGMLRVGGISAGSVAAPNSRLEVIEPTIQNDVLRLTSVATNDDVTERVLHNRVTTTDGTQTTAQTVACPLGTTTYVEAIVVGRRTGGSAGTAGDGCAYHLAATFKDEAGTATQIGTTTVVVSHESQAGFDATIDANSSNFRIRVTGATNNNMTWHVHLRVFQVAS